ncbi:hypothetical protein NKG94_38735 [Micromonospora sp. M12]
MQRDQVLARRYRLLERLGTGGMSDVYRAYDEVLERDVAVKVLVASDTNARQRIRARPRRRPGCRTHMSRASTTTVSRRWTGSRFRSW